MGAFIVYAPAYDDRGPLMRPVGNSGGWGVTFEQLEDLYSRCEQLGIGRDVWPDCTAGRLSMEEIRQRNGWLKTGISMLPEEQVRTFELDSGEPILKRIREAIKEGNLIVITH